MSVRNAGLRGRDSMGKVAVFYRIMPEGVDVDLAAITEKVKEIVGPGALGRLEEKPVAFGLKYLEVVCIMDDKDNNSQELEDRFRELEGVQSVEITDVNLI